MSSSSRASRTGNASAARSSRKAHASAAQPPAAMTSADASSAFTTPIPEELRRAWVAEAAYYIAERRGFSGGSPEDDWCQAEVEIAQLLAGTRH
ncbi:MAG: DUF2934 domain-containing protein [Burkholderiaceae bacterium]|nr:DUF2934 domain-containing protein [Burkholderiaceae bacterium]ODS99447.1 MAG: hypothetical protein ABS56_01105 [Lautropia sp. SCN 69-89]